MSIFELYRSCSNQNELLSTIAKEVKIRLNCTTTSIFLYDENYKALKLAYSTSKTEETIDDYYGSKFAIYNMLFDEKDRILSSENMLTEYPKDDIDFENIDSLEGLACSRIFNNKNKPIGIIRVLNKIDDQKKSTPFLESDIYVISRFSNIIGASLSIFSAEKKSISFLSSLTHELSAPINGVKNCTKFLLGYLHRKEKSQPIDLILLKRHLNDILSFSELSISLVNNLTMFSRSGKLETRNLELKYTLLAKHIISRCTGNLTYLLKKRNYNRGNIKVINVQKIPALKVDRKILLQVFTNLLHNSIKYSHSDNKLFKITISHKINRFGNLEIYINDYGIGIDEDYSIKIFYKGERTPEAMKRDPSSTGIGLATVRNLLKTHGMSIKLTNTSNPTTFMIQIPKKFFYKEI